MNTAPKKIAVLGGGVSSMTSVLELTSEDDWQSKYDITVYQLGWRLGGKCASGRNTNIAQRIEEHGLHLWFGFYDNAFNLVQQVYAENNRPQTMPLSTWQEAFKPYNFVVLEEDALNWFSWPFLLAANDKVPGTMDEQPPIPKMIWEMASQMHATFKSYSTMVPMDQIPPEETHQSLLEIIAKSIENELQPVIEVVEDLGIKALECIIDELEKLIAEDPAADVDKIIEMIEKFLEYVWKRVETQVEKNETALQFWILTDFGLSTLKGILVDDLFINGYDSINNIDFKAWLKRNMASDITVESCLVQSLYSLNFAGRDNYTFEAGTVLRGAMLLGFHYKGSFYYRMMAGMGDTIFAPIYEVLKKRGVVFKFFNKVNELQLSDDKNSVQKIIIGKQANLTGPDYNPLVTVKALPCWPSYPLYDQLKEGQTLQELGIDLESPWSNWQDVETITLEKGVDFDIVLYGISIGSIPYLCKQILEISQQWRDMIQHIVAIPTQGLQIWLKPDVTSLGWEYPTSEKALLGTYVEPYDTYSDMSDLIKRECWDGQVTIKSYNENENYWPTHLAYFCGPLLNLQMQPFTDHSFPDKVLAAAKETQIQFLNTLAWRIWPDAVDDEKNFKWDLLVDYNSQSGPDRLNSQFSHVNISPSELYVLSVVGSSKYRLEPTDTPCSNLVITGDWINTGINAGCVEASVIAGKKSARAISGKSFYIKWEKDLVKNKISES